MKAILSDDGQLDRIKELIVSDDPYKTAYLIKQKETNPAKLDIGEITYLKYFMYFENNILDENNHKLNIANPFDNDKFEQNYKTIFDLLKADFNKVYENNTDNDHTEYIFLNEQHKSFIFLELNKKGEMLDNMRFIIPLKTNDETKIEVFNCIPSDLSDLLNCHKVKQWPVIEYGHPSYFSNNEEKTIINSEDIDDDERIRKLYILDMEKLSKIENISDIIGNHNMVILNSVTMGDTSLTYVKSKGA